MTVLLPFFLNSVCCEMLGLIDALFPNCVPRHSQCLDRTCANGFRLVGSGHTLTPLVSLVCCPRKVQSLVGGPVVTVKTQLA